MLHLSDSEDELCHRLWKINPKFHTQNPQRIPLEPPDKYLLIWGYFLGTFLLLIHFKTTDISMREFFDPCSNKNWLMCERVFSSFNNKHTCHQLPDFCALALPAQPSTANLPYWNWGRLPFLGGVFWVLLLFQDLSTLKIPWNKQKKRPAKHLLVRIQFHSIASPTKQNCDYFFFNMTL